MRTFIIAPSQEPIRDPRGIPLFFLQTGLPVALDESLDGGVGGMGWDGNLEAVVAVVS